jgi:integrase/recombinase XerD
MSELRKRMDNDMVLRGMAARTREAYLNAVRGLAKFYRRSPDQISVPEVQGYLLHLARKTGAFPPVAATSSCMGCGSSTG